MSVLQYPEKTNSNVQMWDNAAFYDGGDSEVSTVNFSWSKTRPVSSTGNSHQSFESDCTKENVSPLSNVVANALPKPEKMGKGNGFLDEQNLDFQIEKIEKEISKLSTKLELLRLQKAKRSAKVMEKRGRIVPAKFMNPPKELIRCSEDERKVDESMNVSAKMGTPRRGMSLGPAEIMRGMSRRGISLGPAEIYLNYSASKMKQLGGKQEITPIQSSVNRRKSCYWKLNDVDELRVTKERGKSTSVSPKSRCKTVDRPQIPKQAVTTIGVKKMGKKEGGVVSLIQPKKLFVNDGEKSGLSKSAMKGGRVVASRYSQGTSGGGLALKELRKRSSSENEEELKKSDKKRVSLVANFEVGPRIKTVCEALCFEERKRTKEYQ